MANEYELAIDVDASPAVTWAVVGDPTGVPRWFSKYTECSVDGNIRTLRNAEGAELVERILDWDAESLRYRYEVIDGAPLRSHEATFEVHPRDGERSRVIWRTRAEFLDPDIDTEERLAAAQREGLERLKALCETVG